MLRYLKGTEDFGLKCLTKEDTLTKHEEFSSDWPKEVFDEKRAVVWSDSSYASQEGQKSLGALVLTQRMAPVFLEVRKARIGFLINSRSRAPNAL